MQKAVLYKGQAQGGNSAADYIQIYEDPEFVVGQDRAKLRHLNRELEHDPGMELPQGFYKVYEKE